MEYEEELGLTQKEFNEEEELKNNLEATMADLVEYPDRYEFVVNMPGIRPDKIKVVVHTFENENALVMRGEGDKVDNDEVKYLKRERHVGNFIKGCIIPWNADLETISAVSKDGLLTVTIQKLLPTVRKNIPVTAG